MSQIIRERIVTEYWLMLEHRIDVKVAQILIYKFHGIPKATLCRWAADLRKSQSGTKKA